MQLRRRASNVDSTIPRTAENEIPLDGLSDLICDVSILVRFHPETRAYNGHKTHV